MNPIVAPVIRRAILDLLCDIGGEHNHGEITDLLNQLGHRVARRDVLDQLEWLASDAVALVTIEGLQHFTVARIVADGRDVASGVLAVEGVSRHKTGE